MTIGIICNPNAGNCESIQNYENLLTTSNNTTENEETVVKFTKYPKHATEICQEFINVLKSGDGTINEVVNGYILSNGKVKNAMLLLVNAGTGGDYCKSLPFPTLNYYQKDLLCKIINELQTGKNYKIHEIDAGCIIKKSIKDCCTKEQEQFHYYVNVASIGMSSKIASFVNENRWIPFLFGKWAYLIGSVVCNIINIFYQPLVNIEIQEQQQFNANESPLKYYEKLPLYLMAASKGKYFGGGIKIAPTAETKDGMLTLTLLSKLSIKDVLFDVLPKALSIGSNTFGRNELKCSKVNVECSSPSEHVYVEADGEIIGDLPVEISVIPKAVQLIELNFISQ